MMKPETIRRTLNINNFESLSLEGTGEHNDPNVALLFASRNFLIKALTELTRIYNVRSSLGTSSEYDKVTWAQLTYELDIIQQDLQTKGITL